jgi:hypothetical protein
MFMYVLHASMRTISRALRAQSSRPSSRLGRLAGGGHERSQLQPERLQLERTPESKNPPGGGLCGTTR